MCENNPFDKVFPVPDDESDLFPCQAVAVYQIEKVNDFDKYSCTCPFGCWGFIFVPVDEVNQPYCAGYFRDWFTCFLDEMCEKHCRYTGRVPDENFDL